MTIHSDSDLAGMRAVGRLVADTLRAMMGEARPGSTTKALDTVAERFARRAGARSAPQLAYQFPGFTCISLNDEIVHGVPGSRIIRAGDVLKLDVTLELDGYIADAAVTVLLAPVSVEARQLRRCARAAFSRALVAARAGRPVRDIGQAIDREVRRTGFAVVPDLGGHGVGRRIHEAPAVPNFADPAARQILTNGMVLAVEPMLTATPTRVVQDPDGWTLRTLNRSLAIHHEHTIIVRNGEPEILTAA